MSDHYDLDQNFKQDPIDEIFGDQENDHQILNNDPQEDDFFTSIQQNHPITPYNNDNEQNLNINELNYPESNQENQEAQIVDEIFNEDGGDFLQPEENNEISNNNEFQYNVEPEDSNSQNIQNQEETNLEFLRDQNDPESFFDQLSIPQGNEVQRKSIDTTEHEEFIPNDDDFYRPNDDEYKNNNNNNNYDDDDEFQVSDYENNPFEQSEILQLGEQTVPENKEYEPLPQWEDQQNSIENEEEEQEENNDNDSLFNGSTPKELEKDELEQLLDENDKPNNDEEQKENVEEQNDEDQQAIDLDSKLDDLFAKDNEDDFIKALGQKKQESNEVDSTIDKLAALDLSLDDDLLLDEEFLDEPIESKPLPKQEPIKEHKSYTPTTTNPYIKPSTNQKQNSQQEFVQNLEKSKKKNDAYDFPDGLLINKVRPAPRHTTSNKYAPSAGNSQSTISTLGGTSQDNSLAAPPPSNNLPPQKQSSSNQEQPPQEKKVQPKKSFFEELPGVELPKPNRAVRKPAPVKSVNKFHPMSPVQQQKQPINTAPPAPPKSNKPPPVNPYKPKQGTSPIFQQHVPIVGHTGIAKPNVNPQPNYAPAPNSYMFPPTSNSTPAVPSQEPIGMAPPSSNPPIASAPVNSGLSNNRRISNPINTNLGKNSPSHNSPYVPNAGPYAPSNQPKTHSRAGSLLGGKGGKELNPYAPALSTVPSNNNSPAMTNLHSQQPPHLSNAIVPPSGRIRGISNAKGNIYKTTPKIVKPEELNFRQFPIFNWSISEKVVLLKPNSTYGKPVITIDPIKTFCKDQEIYLNFPGPLSKSKSKKKEILNWFEISSQYLLKNGFTDELLLNNILMEIIKNDGDLKSNDCLKQICLILNPNVNFNAQDLPISGGTTNGYKLDNSGINTVFALIQAGDISKALEYSISKNDWALALVLANFSGPESFSKIASEYARNTFPFSKANNKVLHIMPILLKVIGGNVQSVIQDLTNVPNEGDYANLHWKEIISSVVISGSLKTKEFLIEFGKFLINNKNLIGGEISFILSGLPFGQQGFLVISSGHHSMYTQIYEHILNLNNTSSTPIQFPHLLPIKLKHASTLADYGLINESQKYIDSINSNLKSLGNKSPFITQQLIQEFQNLIMRLSELGSNDSSGWFGSKMSKVNLDKVWGQIDKFIVGGSGEETKQKSNENGVFSKFSPSVSRNASTLDLGTLHTYTSPSIRGGPDQFEKIRSSNQTQIQSNNIYNQQHPGLDSNFSSTSINKYAPSNLKNSPFQNQQSNDRYAPNNSSQSNLIDNSNSIFQQSHNLQQQQQQQKQVSPQQQHSHYQHNQTKPHSPLAQKTTYPYNNPLGPISTSSIGSIPPTNAQPPIQGHGQQNSISSVISGESISNFQTNVAPVITPQVETIQESPELKPGLQLPSSQEKLQQQEKKEDLKLEEKQPTAPQAPPPPIKKTKSAPPTARSNPYAPSSNLKSKPRRNKYGPPTIGENNDSSLGLTATSNNKYGPPPSNNSYAPSVVSNYAPSIDQNQKLPEPESNVLDENNVEESQKCSKIQPPQNQYQPPPSHIPQEPQQQHLKSRKSIPNIDDSFETESSIIVAESTNILQTPKPKPLTLQAGGIYNPSTSNSNSNGLDGFPIPGSPDYTTRANSVYGGNTTNPNLSSTLPIGVGTGGFFSSRLSQSQQSAMYQQYEVQDDTVKDYIPILEEDEDDDEELIKKEKTRKAKEEAEKEEAEKQKQAQAQKKQKNNGQQKDGWFNNWLTKNDGKPKPIRAKLGEKINVFYYDEKHKRWLDKTKPIEEQLNAGKIAPPPPSMKKKKNIENNNTNGGSDGASGPPPPLKSNLPPKQTIPNSSNTTKENNDSSQQSQNSLPIPTGNKPTAPKKKFNNLANANLDDLLSMTESTAGGGGGSRKSKRNVRRNYINVLEK
ncbi:SEC16 [Candida pseudojiufengensis]|uniref:SEC16 n=1 Tax=Candida pseudojiufengensis TaxID=497109 RepID=UPI0022249E0B|nr:SEC16 [Candida pseudojiufengensis]KAI5964320.1 SEC16 [Candida pseudojiufengensis]